MSLTIHAIGDSAFLATILNSIAMLFATQDLRTAAGIGAVVGILMQVFRGLMNSGSPSIRYVEFIVSILLWMMLFQPTTSLSIEDAYTGEVRVVANVPLGPAVSGAIISELGYGLTTLFETAFTVPTLTRQGYAGTLETLTQVRRNLLSRLSLGKALDPTPTRDIATSVSQYVRDCTLTGVDLGVIGLSSLLNTGGLPDAFRYDSDVYATEIRDGSLPLLVTCSEAWPRLRNLITDQALPLLIQHLSHFMKEPGATDPIGTIQSALDALTQGQQDASSFILAAAMVPLFEQGVLGRHQDSLKASQVAIVESAIAQRNTQWATEQSMFVRIVRPMLTWIEGFSYAVTPIMAFTLLLGAQGIRMCGQYALMLIWIQFWMPILAIGNLYITLAAQGGFSALAKARFALDSVSGLYQMDLELQNWLAVGGMLASATPAIALMLVYGGSVTATHFLGRMQGGDFIDEKIASPPLLQSPALIGIESRHRHAPLSGLSLSGADHVLPTFSFSQDQGFTESGSSARRQRSSETFMEALRIQGSKSQALLEEESQSQIMTQKSGSQSSATDRFLESTGQDLALRYRESGLSGHDFATLLGGAIMGRYAESSERPDQGSTHPMKMALGLEGQLQDRFHVGEGRAHDIASDLSKRITSDHGFQAELAHSVAKDATEGQRSSAHLGLRSDALGEMGRSAQAAIEAETSYQSSTHTSQRSGTEGRIGALEASQRIATQPEAFLALQHGLTQVGLQGDAERLGAAWQHQGLIQNADQSYAAAGLALLTGHAHPIVHPLSEEEAILSKTLGRTILGEVFHAPYVETDLAPQRIAHDLQAPDAVEGLPSRVQMAIPENPLSQRESVEEAALKLQQQVTSTLDNGESLIGQTADANFYARKDSQREGENRMTVDRQSALTPGLDAAAQAASPAEALDDISGAFYRAIYPRLKTLGATGIEAVSQVLHDADRKGLSPSETLRLLFKEAPGALESELNRWIGGEVAKVQKALTPAQTRYFRAALLESFAGYPLTGDYHILLGDLAASRAALDRESGARGPVLATLLRKIAAGGRSDLLGLIRSYNGLGLQPRP